MKPLIFKALAISIAVLCTSSVFAQKQAYNLEQCIEIALKNNLQLKRANNSVEINNNNLKQLYYNRLPGVSASGSQSYSSGGRSVNPYDNTVVEGENFNSNSFSLGASMNVFNGFANNYSIKQNKDLLNASKFDVEQRSNTIKLNIVLAYTSILTTGELLDNAKAQVEASKSQLERQEKLYKAGATAESNYLNAKAQLAQDEATVISQENNLALNKLNLQQLMQLPADEEFEVTKPDIQEPGQVILDLGSKEIYSAALSNMPEIKAAEARMKSSDKSILIARAGYLPSISANGGWFTNYSSLAFTLKPTGAFTPGYSLPIGYFNDGGGNRVNVLRDFEASPVLEKDKIKFKNQFDNNLRQSLGLSLNVPIFSNMQNRTAVANAVINRENARLDAETAKNTLRQDVEQAYVNAKASAKTFQAAKISYNSQKEALRATEQRYNVGSANYVEYITARTNVLRAENELTRTKYEYVLRTKILDFYQGKPLKF